MLAFTLAFLPSGVASYLFTKVLGHENRIPAMVIGVIIGYPIGLGAFGLIQGRLVWELACVIGALAGTFAGFVAAAPFVFGL